MIKKILQKFLKLLGYKITKFNTVDTVDLDKMTMLLINKKNLSFLTLEPIMDNQ